MESFVVVAEEDGDDGDGDDEEDVRGLELASAAGAERFEQKSAEDTSMTLRNVDDDLLHHNDDDDDNYAYGATTTNTTTTMTTTRNDDDDDGDDGVFDDENDDETNVMLLRQEVWRNFLLFSILVASLPASALACLALATAELGSLGAWQSGVLYASYTASAVTVATLVVKVWGTRRALQAGMALFCMYVTCFVVAVAAAADPLTQPTTQRDFWALAAAAVGGAGAGILWTAQGTYVAQAAEEYAALSRQTTTTTSRRSDNNDVNTMMMRQHQTTQQATSLLAGVFAFVFLLEETVLDVLSTILTTAGCPWMVVFAVYATVAVAATAGMRHVKEYPRSPLSVNPDGSSSSSSSWRVVLTKATAAGRLLVQDAKMKYFIGLNASFGLVGAFLNSYVNAQVVPVVFENGANDVGMLVALHGGTAALFSLLFGYIGRWTGKTAILLVGTATFLAVVVPFLIQPDVTTTVAAGTWTRRGVAALYVMEGIGRATFEGTLKAKFADYFGYEKEGAYANIILQNGLFTCVGYILSVRLHCSNPETDPYCIEYKDGSQHNVGAFCVIVVVASVVAAVGIVRADRLHAASLARSNSASSSFVSGAHAEHQNAPSSPTSVSLQQQQQPRRRRRQGRRYDTVAQQVSHDAVEEMDPQQPQPEDDHDIQDEVRPLPELT